MTVQSNVQIFSFLCLFLSMTMVGANIAVGKIILEDIPVFAFAALRFLIALVILAPGMIGSRRRRGLNGPAWRGLFVQSFFGCFLFSIFMLYGVTQTSATSAGIITSALPSVIILLAWVGLGERITHQRAVMVLLAMAGIATLNLQGVVAGGSNGVLGNALVMGAVLSEALFAVISRHISIRVHPWAMAFTVNLFGFILFFPLAVPQLLVLDWVALDITVLGWLLFYAITASVLSFLLWYRGISAVSASVAGLFTGVIPLSAALIGAAFLGERLTFVQGLGMVLVLMAIGLGAWQERITPAKASSRSP